VLLTQEQYAEAEEVYRKLLDVAPGMTEVRRSLARVLVEQGKGEAALAVVQQEQNEGWRLFVLSIVLDAAGRKAEADEALQQQITTWRELGGCAAARTYAYRGDHDHALHWLERCYEQRDIGILWLISEPLFRGMSEDPRFKALQRKLNLPDPPLKA
jgi:tetratricopeptide (TPR) repeat protein